MKNWANIKIERITPCFDFSTKSKSKWYYPLLLQRSFSVYSFCNILLGIALSFIAIILLVRDDSVLFDFQQNWPNSFCQVLHISECEGKSNIGRRSDSYVYGTKRRSSWSIVFCLWCSVMYSNTALIVAFTNWSIISFTWSVLISIARRYFTILSSHSFNS